MHIKYLGQSKHLKNDYHHHHHHYLLLLLYYREISQNVAIDTLRESICFLISRD